MSQSYYTYRIRIVNYDRVQVEVRDPQNESLGEPGGVFGYKGKLRKGIDQLVTAAHQNSLAGSQVKALGEALFDALLDPVLRQDFVNLYNRAVHVEKKLLRIELDVDERAMPEVAALPWEFMCVPTAANLGSIWLGTAPDLIFSRRRAQWHAPQPIQLGTDEKLRVAVAVAAPTNLPPVVYELLLNDLQRLTQQQAERITLLPVVNSASPEAIDDVLAQEPHVFHFIGHGRLNDETGTPVGQLALVDDFDEALWVDADYFSELLNRHRPGVVLLQACEGGTFSASQAFVGVASRVVQQNIPVVVAMQYEVSNSTASRFARRFYQQLAAGEPVDNAAQNGRRTIALGPTQYRSRDFATPVIVMRVRDGHLFQRQEAAAGPTLVDIPRDRPVKTTPVKPVVTLAEGPVDLPQLARQIGEQFSLEELQGLCYGLHIDYENLPGSSKSARARELVQYCQRRGMIQDLRRTCAELRPHVAW